MTLESFLVSLGVNITSSAIYDILKSFLLKEPNPTLDRFNKEIQKHLAIENAKIFSEKIIEFLAKNGDIIISGSNIFAKESICLKSSMGTEFQIKNGSSTRTDQTSMEIGMGAFIKGSGGATIQQSRDGITFSV